VILVDSNIPMYLIGAPHPLKDAARRLTEDAVAQRRLEFVEPAFTALLGLVDVVYPIERADVERAHRLLRTTERLSARDALHVAVMQAHDIGRILSFDGGFDGMPGG
jgi:predicted nucleic acid-binding protein